MIEDDRNAVQVLAAFGLKIGATDQEIEVAGHHLNRRAHQEAEEAIRVVIAAVRSARDTQD